MLSGCVDVSTIQCSLFPPKVQAHLLLHPHWSPLGGDILVEVMIFIFVFFALYSVLLPVHPVHSRVQVPAVMNQIKHLSFWLLGGQSSRIQSCSDRSNWHSRNWQGRLQVVTHTEPDPAAPSHPRGSSFHHHSDVRMRHYAPPLPHSLPISHDVMMVAQERKGRKKRRKKYTKHKTKRLFFSSFFSSFLSR